MSNNCERNCPEGVKFFPGKRWRCPDCGAVYTAHMQGVEREPEPGQTTVKSWKQ